MAESGRRPYRLGKREASVAETRRRIIAAAIEEYATSGIEGTSMQAVARRADVAPGTVLYHYPTPDDLTRAVVDTWVAEMQMPTPESIDPAASLGERVRTLVEELYGLFERSEAAYQIYAKSPQHPVLARAEEAWQRNVAEMMERALAGIDHARVFPVVGALVDPGFRGILLRNGMSPEEAATTAVELALGWLTRS